MNGAVAEFSPADARHVEERVNTIAPRQAAFNGFETSPDRVRSATW